MWDFITMVVAFARDRAESILDQLEVPWILKIFLSFITNNPGLVALLLAILAGTLIYSYFSRRGQMRDLEAALAESAQTFPRRDWERLGRLDATIHLQQALRIFSRGESQEGIAVHYAALGLLYFQRGDAVLAETNLRKAIERFEASGHREGIAVYARYLSLLYWEQGEPERALTFAEQSLAMYRAIGVWQHEGGDELIAAIKEDIGETS